jgi:hypothetical protein
MASPGLSKGQKIWPAGQCEEPRGAGSIPQAGLAPTHASQPGDLLPRGGITPPFSRVHESHVVWDSLACEADASRGILPLWSERSSITP